MIYQLFFAVAVMGACETGTCRVCKAETGCDWYGFDCFNKTSTEITTLNIPATANCTTCQAGSCEDCSDQEGCAWFASVVPGIPGKCEVNGTNPIGYEVVDTCPTCQNYDAQGCDMCNSRSEEGCGWYTLPGGVGGKCREAAPSFAYTKVPAGSCDTGSLCSGVTTCGDCKEVMANNATACNWYTSKSPSFYSSKCDDKTAGIVSSNLYDAVGTTCPQCAGTSCIDCKAENGCKWYAANLGLGTAFGECKTASATKPAGKSEVVTCPATCDLHSCVACRAATACSWYTGSSIIDDGCDLAADSNLHPAQTAASSCGACAADRCYECNNLAGCGWYAEKAGFITLREGCFPTASAPAGRTLVSNSDSKCDGVPSGSSEVVVSLGLLAALALFA